MVEKYADAIKSKKDISHKTDSAAFEKMCAQLLMNVAEKKYKDKVISAFMAICSVPQIELAYMAHFLFKNSSYTNKKLASSPKHIMPRLEILGKLVAEVSKDKSQEAGFPWSQMFEMVKRSLEASQKDERLAGAQLLI